MNIWILTSELPPSFGGGIGTYVDRAAVMFSDKKHKVTVLVRDSIKNSIEYVSETLRIIRFKDCVGDYYNFLGYWAALSMQYSIELENRIKNDGEKVDVIEIQEYNAIGYYILQKRMINNNVLNNIPIVLHLHTPTFELDKINKNPSYKFPHYWIGRMEKFCINAADAIMCPSEYLKNQIIGEMEDKSLKIDVLRLPFRNDLIDANITEKKYQGPFLYFGRTEYRKGVLQMLQGAKKLWNKGYNFKIKIIGGDTYFAPKQVMFGEYLKKVFREFVFSGLLEFQGNTPPTELYKEIRNARAVIIPSLYENHPFTCVESMWLKSPMLVSKSGGQSEMVGLDGKSGLVFDWDIEGDFEKKLEEFLSYSPKKLSTMGEEAYNKIYSMCNMDHIYNQRIEYFRDIIDRKKHMVNSCFPANNIFNNSKKHIVLSSNPKVSVVVPFYNLGEYLPKTIKSILKSDYLNLEVIIVNDGSNDVDSLRVLDDIRNSDDRIRVIDIDNQGLANARNVGAKEATSELIAFVDADDLISETFISKSVDVLKRYSNVSFVYSWVQYFDGNEGVWPTFNTELPYVLCGNMLAAFIVIKKEDFLNYGLNRKDMLYGMEDYDAWVNMVKNGCLGVSIPEIHSFYRVRKNSMARQFNRDMIMYLFEEFSKQHSDIISKYSKDVYNLMLANGPGYLWNNPTFEHSDINYVSREINEHMDTENPFMINEELKRIASTKLGQMMIRLALKLKFNKIFR